MGRFALILVIAGVGALISGMGTRCGAAGIQSQTALNRTAKQQPLLKRPFGAAAAQRLVRFQGLDGYCQKLRVSSVDKTSDCAGKLITTRMEDGRNRFYFILYDGSTVAFTTLLEPRAGRQVAEELVVPVDGLLTGPLAAADQTKATGTCDFTDPDTLPVWVKCQASNETGEFAASFLSGNFQPVELDETTAMRAGR